MIKKNAKIIFHSLVMVFLISQFALLEERKKEFEEDEIRKELEETTKVEKIDKGVLFDYGGWLRISPYLFDDPDKKRDLTIYDSRFWFRSLIKKHNEFYIRVKTLAVEYGKGDSYGGDDKYWIKPRLDQGFYKVNLNNVIYNEKEAQIVYPKITLQLGRQYLLLGSGLVYNRVDDGVKIDLHFTGFDNTLIFSQTIKSTDDVDRTRPDATHSERSFIGLQINYTTLGRHRPYLLGLIQRDHNEETPNNPAQGYHYNSNYYGVGVDGAIIPRLEYTAEVIKETGTSYPSFSNTKKSIKASANFLQLKYLPETNLAPIFTLRYLYGSGDNNRGSVTNTVGGNRAGTKDTNFLYFGYVLTGYVLEPKISNLRMYNLTASIKPLKNKEKDFFEDAELGIGYYMYQKNKKDGAISDLRASRAKNDIGKEIDLFYNWKMLSDFTISLRSGIFMPGDAYPNTADDKVSFYNLNLTYSF